MSNPNFILKGVREERERGGERRQLVPFSLRIIQNFGLRNEDFTER